VLAMDDQSGPEREGRGTATVCVAWSKRSDGAIMGASEHARKGIGVREDAPRARMGLMPLACDWCIEAQAVWRRGRRGHLGWWAIETQSAGSWLGDPLVVCAHSPGFALGRHAQLALRREALLCVRSSCHRFSLLRVLELAIPIIPVVLSFLVAGIHYSGSVATVHLQTHRWRYRGRQRREIERQGWGRWHRRWKGR